jgi:hypothetical protein
VSSHTTASDLMFAGIQGPRSSTATGANHLLPSFTAVATSSSHTSVRTPAGGGQRTFSAATARATTAAGSSRVATAVRVDQQVEAQVQEEVEVLSRALGAVTLEQTQATRTTYAQYTSTTAVAAGSTATINSTTSAMITHLERSYQAPAVPHPIDTQQPPLFARVWEGLFGVFLVAHSESGSTKVNSFEQELVKLVLAAGGQGQVRQSLYLISIPHQELAVLYTRVELKYHSEGMVSSCVDCHPALCCWCVVWGSHCIQPCACTAQQLYTVIHSFVTHPNTPFLCCTQVGPGSPGSCKRCVVLSPHNAQCWGLRPSLGRQVDLVDTVDKMQVGGPHWSLLLIWRLLIWRASYVGILNEGSRPALWPSPPMLDHKDPK